MKIWLRENIPFYGIRGSNQPFIIALNSGLYDGFLFYVIIYSPEV